MKFSYSKKKKLPFIITVALTLCILFSIFAPTILAASDLEITSNETAETVVPGTFGEINYVSLGDSADNGYGFVGYEQDSGDLTVYDPMAKDPHNGGKGDDYGLNMYGQGAYPLQFENWMEEMGFAVNHTKLATSAMLPEDFLYLLGGRDSEIDDNYSGYRSYMGSTSRDEAQLSKFRAHIQESVKNADFITLVLGNASFGAFFMDKFTRAFGVFGAPFTAAEEKLTLEYALEGIVAPEDVAVVRDFVDSYMDELNIEDAFAEYGFDDATKMTNAINVFEYTIASFIVNYKLVVEEILKMNPDVGIIFVGLLNTTYGTKIVGENGEVILELGDMMDSMFGMLNDYVKMIPTIAEADKYYPDAWFFFAEQPEPRFICQVFGELKAENWGTIQDGRLSGTTVRSRNITSYNDDILAVLNHRFAPMIGAYLPKITLADAAAADAGDMTYFGATCGAAAQLYVMSAQIYLAIEDAIVECVDETELTIDGFQMIANNIASAFDGYVPNPDDLRGSLCDYLTGDKTLRGMVRIYAMFKAGNGMSVHPTPAGHDKIFATLVHAMPIEYDSQTCAIRDVYYYLYRNGYITFGEALELFTTEMTTFELLDTLYNTILIENAESDDERIEIIGKVYTILKGDSHNVFVSFVDLVFGIYRKLVEADLLNNTEAFNIVDFVYDRLVDDYAVDVQEIYEIATYIYKTLFFTEGEMVVSLAADFDDLKDYNTALPVDKKLEIINIVFGELENSEFVEEAPELAPVLDLYTELKNDEKIGEEALVAIFDIAFEAVAEKTVNGEEVNTEALVAEVTTELATTDKIDLATKAAIVNKVAEVVKNSNLGETTETPVLPEIPDLTKIVGVLDRLDDKYITMDEANELLGKVIELFMKGELNEDTAVVLIKEAYNVVLADLSDEEKIEFIPALYEAIKAEYDLSDEEIFEKHVIIAPSIELFINLRTNNNISDEAILGVLRIALKMISKDDIIGIEDVNAFISQLREQISEDDTFSIEEKIAIIREINIAFPDSVPPEDLAVDIIAKNVSYSEMVQIIFAVDDTSAYGRDVEVLYYLEDPALNPKAKAYKGSYCALGYTAKDGTVYPAFYTAGFPAKNIDNKIYARAHIVGTGVYSDVVEYSVVEYLLERLYLDDITEDQKDLYVKLLEYGAAAQKLLLGIQSNLCTDYVLVNIDGGTIDGKNNQGIYFIGDTVRPYAEGVATWKVTTYNATTGSIETRTISNGATVTINGFTTITSHSAVVAYTPILPDSILPFNSKELLFSV